MAVYEYKYKQEHTYVKSLTTLTNKENASRAALCFTTSGEHEKRWWRLCNFWISSNGCIKVLYVVKNASWYKKSTKKNIIFETFHTVLHKAL